jgi:hypothetical protein
VIPLSKKERHLHFLVAQFYECVEECLEAVAKQEFGQGHARLQQALDALAIVAKSKSCDVIPIRGPKWPGM